MNNDTQPNFFTKIAFSFLLLQFIAITWLVGGMRVELMMSMFAISIFQFIFSRFSTNNTNTKILEKASIFSSVSIVAIVIIQYFNPAIEFVNGEILHQFVRLEHIDWLPKSTKSEFLRGDILFELCKILTAVLSLLSCIKIFEYKKLANIAIIFFAFNIFAMSVWSIYQKNQNYLTLYNYFYSSSEFYGTFFLSNSAGLFINLGVGLSLALTLLRKNIFVKFIFFAMALISSYSSYYSGSNGALIMCIATWLCFAFILIFTVIKFFVGRNGSIVVCTILCISALIVTFSTPQIYNLINSKKDLTDSSNSRFAIYKIAIKTIEENPIYGTGLGSIKQVLPMQQSKLQKHSTISIPSILYNAHSDILNYLIEFGILGVSIISISIFAWGYTIIKNLNNLKPENYMLIATVLICFAHASLDMHLKTPSIMIAFVSISVLSICKLRFNELNYYK